MLMWQILLPDGILKKHQLIHSDYACSVCDKSMSDAGNLEMHEMVHTGEQPHACYVCNKTFA
jgi:uncharacterized Zn-finger protein